MASQIDLQYSHTIGVLSAQGGRGFLNPVDMVFGQDDTIYVLSRGSDLDILFFPLSRRVTMCTADGEFRGQFSTGGKGDGQMRWPSSIAADPDGNIYVSDEALHRISIFDRQGNFLDKWGVQGQGDGQFDRPAGIAFDSEANLLVVDGLNHRIQRYTRDGRFLGGWGRHGTGPGEFDMPWGVTIDGGGNVYVSDWRNDRIQKFDAGGVHLATLGKPGQGDGQVRRPAGVAVDDAGNVYVADWGNERVQVLDPDGGFLAKLRGQADLSNWAEQYFISNQDELEERGKADLEPDLPPTASLRDQSAVTEKLFWAPSGVALDDQGRLFVVDTCRHRIQIYDRAAVGAPA